MTHTNTPSVPEPALRAESAFYRGWLMLPIATLMTVCTLPGQTVVVSQFNTSIRDSLGIPLESLALAYLIGTLAAAFPLTYVGMVSDRIGPRLTTFFVTLGLTLACLTAASATNIIALTLAFFMLRFLGQGALGMLASHLLALWFERRLATVESIKHAAMSLAGAGAPLVVVWLINTQGWRSTYTILGLAVSVLILPLVVTLFRNKPEDIGQHLDNEPPKHHEKWHEAHETNLQLEAPAHFTLKQTTRTLAFWCVALPSIFAGLVGTAMLFHIQPIMEEKNVPDFEAAGALAASSWALVQFVSILGAGPIADRVHPRILLPISGALTAASLTLMALTPNALGVTLAMGIFGLAQGISMAVSGPTIARYFGRPNHGSIRGFMTTLMVAGTALGPFIIALGARLAAATSDTPLSSTTDGPRVAFALPLLVSAGAGLLIAALSALTSRPAPPKP